MDDSLAQKIFQYQNKLCLDAAICLFYDFICLYACVDIWYLCIWVLFRGICIGLNKINIYPLKLLYILNDYDRWLFLLQLHNYLNKYSVLFWVLGFSVGLCLWIHLFIFISYYWSLRTRHRKFVWNFISPGFE